MTTTPSPAGPRPAPAHGGPDPHAAAAIAGRPLGSEGSGPLVPARNAVIAAVALCLIVAAFFVSYATAFGNPIVRDMTIAVSAPARIVMGLRAAGGLHPQPVADAAAARAAVLHRRADGAIAVGGAVTGVAAALGIAGGVVLTILLIITGNPSSGGPVSTALLPAFFRTLNPYLPQGGGLWLLRDVVYFGSHELTRGAVCLLAWGGSGLLLASIAVLGREIANRRTTKHRGSRDRAAGSSPHPAEAHPGRVPGQAKRST